MDWWLWGHRWFFWCMWQRTAAFDCVFN
jgi:hypothetical protein